MTAEAYLPMPKEIYFGIPKLNLTYTQKEVLRFVAGKAYEWPETRTTLQVELATRYIGEAIGIAYQHVSDALSELEAAGYIIWKRSRTKGIASLITFLPEIIKEAIKSVTAEVTNLAGSVTKTVTNAVKSVTAEVTNIKTISKKEQQTNKTVDDVPILNIEKNKPSINSNPKTSSVTSSPVVENNDLFKKLPAPPPGVISRVLTAGVKDLQNRGITDLATAVKRIGKEINKRPNIKNINGYFRQLCRVMDFSTTSTIGAAHTVSNSQALIALKEQEINEKKFQQWEEEQRQEEEKAKQEQKELQLQQKQDKAIDYEIELMAMKVSCPDKVKEIEKDLRKEYGFRVWEFTPGKEKLIVERFAERYGFSVEG